MGRRKTYYVVVTPSGRKAFNETFRTKTEALRAIQDAIYGAASSPRIRLNAIKRYAKYRVKKIKR